MNFRYHVSSVFAGMVLLLLAFSPALQAQPAPGAPETSRTHAPLPPAILFDTFDGITLANPPYAVISSYLTDFLAYAAGADDFTVPPGPNWQIQTIEVLGNYLAPPTGGGTAGPAASFNVYITGDAGSLPDTYDLPGGSIYAAEDLAYVEVGDGDPVITLPSGGVSLSPGTYWLIVQANMEFLDAGQWNWTESALVPDNGTPTGSESAWTQDQAIVGDNGPLAPSACTGQWGARILTCELRDPFAGNPDPDFAFRLVGTELPVELVSFEALVEARRVRLSWQTASETDNAGFAVEGRRSQVEGLSWGELGFVDGHGTTLDEQSYSFRTRDLEPGTWNLRLKQIDFDGAFEYSDVVTVEVGVPGQFVLGDAYPNPFSARASFELVVAREQAVSATLYDALGRRVSTLHEGVMPPGLVHRFDIEADGLPGGIYVYRVVGESFSETRSVLLTPQ